VNTVAAGLGTDVKDMISDALGLGVKNLILLRQAEAEHVDQRIEGVAIVEIDFSSYRGNSDGVSVSGYTGDNSFHDSLVFRLVKGTES
jgi:hypothetical protein